MKFVILPGRFATRTARLRRGTINETRKKHAAVTAVAKEILEQRERSIGVIARLQPAGTNDAVVISKKSPPSLSLSLFSFPPFLFSQWKKSNPFAERKYRAGAMQLKRSQ